MPITDRNRGDIDENMCTQLRDKGIFDPIVKQAANELKPVVLYPESTAGKEIRRIWNRLKIRLQEENLL